MSISAAISEPKPFEPFLSPFPWAAQRRHGRRQIAQSYPYLFPFPPEAQRRHGRRQTAFGQILVASVPFDDQLLVVLVLLLLWVPASLASRPAFPGPYPFLSRLILDLRATRFPS